MSERKQRTEADPEPSPPDGTGAPEGAEKDDEALQPVAPAVLPGDLLGGKFLDPSGR